MDNLYTLFANLPKQNTKEWKDAREIGGSDLATVLGVGFKSRCELMREKVFMKEIDSDNPNFHWGHLFEPIHKKLIERALNTEVHEFGSLPWKSGYTTSPDGVFNTTVEALKNILSKQQIAEIIERFGEGELLCVLELKAPARRVINGEIPKYYIPQLYSELCVVPGSQLLLFSEAIFRRCTYEQYINADNSAFTIAMPIRGGDPYKFNTALQRGLVMFFGDTPAVLNDIPEIMRINGCVDLGKVNPEIFFAIINLWYNGQLTANYAFEPTEFGAAIAICPWKLYQIDYHVKYKREDYLDVCWPAIQLCLDTIRELKTRDDLDDVQKNISIKKADLEIRKIVNGIKKNYDLEI